MAGGWEALALKMQESGENYLETILILKNTNSRVRSVDIARSLSFTKPSISRAMSILKQAGYITMEEDGLIELTQTGLEKAKNVYERHRLLSSFLQSIGVNEKTAAEDACRMEHVISEETFIKMKEYIQKKSGER